MRHKQATCESSISQASLQSSSNSTSYIKQPFKHSQTFVMYSGNTSHQHPSKNQQVMAVDAAADLGATQLVDSCRYGDSTSCSVEARLSTFEALVSYLSSNLSHLLDPDFNHLLQLSLDSLHATLPCSLPLEDRLDRAEVLLDDICTVIGVQLSDLRGIIGVQLSNRVSPPTTSSSSASCTCSDTFTLHSSSTQSANQSLGCAVTAAAVESGAPSPSLCHLQPVQSVRPQTAVAPSVAPATSCGSISHDRGQAPASVPLPPRTALDYVSAVPKPGFHRFSFVVTALWLPMACGPP